MSFANWLRNRWLSPRRTVARDITDLLQVADRSLGDSDATGLSPDGRMQFAYTAALAIANAALAACGYRTERDSQHYRLVQSLELTLGSPPELIATLETFRRKRNTSAYERVGQVSGEDADEMVRLARELRDQIEPWLNANHPGLLAG